MNIKIGSFIICLLAVFFFPTNQLSAKKKPKEICLLADKSYKVFDELVMTKIPSEEADRLSKIRPCVKSYPWPKGKFLTKTESANAVDSLEMKTILEEVDEAIENYDPQDSDKYRSVMVKLLFDTKYTQEEIVGYRLNEGMDVHLLKLFGSFIYLHLLNNEGKFESALNNAEEYIKEYNITPAITAFDELEDATYFSRQSLFNLILVNKYKALAGQTDGTLQEKVQHLYDYSLIRDSVRVQSQSFGDPFKNLFSNAGCNSVIK